MQNPYFADVGDFVKYGLLRGLLASLGSEAKLGVIWYMTPDGLGSVNDGNHDGYLMKPEKYRDRDRDLFDCLLNARAGGVAGRNVKVIEDSGLLGSATFFGEHVPPPSAKRTAWFGRAAASVADANVVFVDPDNGLQTTRPNEKHVLWSELRSLLDGHRPRTVVVYQHHRMHTSLVGFPERHLAACVSRLNPLQHEPLAVVSRRGTARAFLVLTDPMHQTAVRSTLKALTASWGGTEGNRLFEPMVAVAPAAGSAPPPPSPPAASPSRGSRIDKLDASGRNAPPKGVGCYCGCTKSTKSHFVPGHDKRVEVRLLAKGVTHEDIRSRGIAALARDHGFGPQGRSA